MSSFTASPYNLSPGDLESLDDIGTWADTVKQGGGVATRIPSGPQYIVLPASTNAQEFSANWAKGATQQTAYAGKLGARFHGAGTANATYTGAIPYTPAPVNIQTMDADADAILTAAIEKNLPSPDGSPSVGDQVTNILLWTFAGAAVLLIVPPLLNRRRS